MGAPTLLVLAAGMGSRYGGLKQLDPVGPSGETLLDYSVHDAMRAGFERVVFLIRREIEAEFRARIGSRYEGRVPVGYACQQLGDLPEGFHPPAGRTKPWGTAHAVWCARAELTTPFAAINADDFYGAESYRVLRGFLADSGDPGQAARFAMAAFRLDRTLSEHGTVARGCCTVGPDGFLQGVEEVTGISRRDDGSIGSAARTFPPQTPVSMNFWGFTPQVFPLLEDSLRRFLTQHGASPAEECYLPTAVTSMILSGEATVQALPTESDWFGVTYREDRARVVAALERLVREGVYPKRLLD